MMSDDLRVVILSSPVEARLARQINEWLETNKVEVVKITYQITSSGYPLYSASPARGT